MRTVLYSPCSASIVVRPRAGLSLLRLAPALPVIPACVFGSPFEVTVALTSIHEFRCLFVAYPEYWLLSTEFRYHQYPRCYLDRELADPEERLWNIAGGVGSLLRVHLTCRYLSAIDLCILFLKIGLPVPPLRHHRN